MVEVEPTINKKPVEAENGENELNKYFPDFNFYKINRFKGDKIQLTEEELIESAGQYELALKYFNELAALSPTELESRALLIEKLINPNEDPKKLEDNFRRTYKIKQKEFKEQHQQIESANRSTYLSNDQVWENFIKNSETGKISGPEIEHFTNEVNNERLIIQYITPDYFRISALFVPGLAAEAIRRARHNFNLKGKEITRTEARYKKMQGRIKEFEDLEKKYFKNKSLRIAPPQILH